MANDSQGPLQPNTLGKTSLILGILGSCFVFCTGLCAGVGKEQGWLKAIGVLLFIVGATAAFLGALAAFLGFGGLFGRNRPRGPAIVGIILGLFTVFLFLAILNAVK